MLLFESSIMARGVGVYSSKLFSTFNKKIIASKFECLRD